MTINDYKHMVFLIVHHPIIRRYDSVFQKNAWFVSYNALLFRRFVRVFLLHVCIKFIYYGSGLFKVFKCNKHFRGSAFCRHNIPW